MIIRGNKKTIFTENLKRLIQKITNKPFFIKKDKSVGIFAAYCIKQFKNFKKIINKLWIKFCS